MSWESIIDNLKEWVLGKDYQSGADLPEWTMPLSVAGVLDPDSTCTYLKAGTYNDQPYYRRLDGAYFLWWDGFNTWFISPELGTLGVPVFYRKDPNIEGAYLPDAGAAGTATISFGYTYLKTNFIDRGDPAAYDWDHNDLTIDDGWHDLDLSAIVPAGAKSVEFNLYVSTTAVSKTFMLRKNGNANIINSAGLVPPVAGVPFRGDAEVACDVDRKIEYFGNAGAFNYIYIVVRHWRF